MRWFVPLFLSLLMTSHVVVAEPVKPGTPEADQVYFREELKALQAKLRPMQQAGLRGPNESLSRAYDDVMRKLGDMGRFDEALALQREATERGADDGLLLLTVFKVRFQAGEWDAARQALDLADQRMQQEFGALAGTRSDNPVRELEHWLVNRSEWAANHLYLELALKQGAQAARWGSAACNYSRLQILTMGLRGPIAAALKRVQKYDADLREGRGMPAAFEQQSCGIADAYYAVLALAARAQAGLPVNGDAELQAYGMTSSGATGELAEVAAADAPRHRFLLEHFLLGTPADDALVVQLVNDHTEDVTERPDSLCESYYLLGMHARYVAHDEAAAAGWFTKAVNTGSTGSFEYVLARTELGLPAAAPRVSGSGKKVRQP